MNDHVHPVFQGILNAAASTPPADVRITNEGSIFLVRPLTPAGKRWIAEHVEDPTWFGGALAVEHRYIRGLATGMAADGLEVE
jgi:hypothetical protein